MTRMLTAVVFVTVLVALVAAAWYARAGASAAQAAQSERLALQRQAESAERQLANLEARERYQQRAMAVLDRADESRFEASAWSQRRLEYSRRELSRREAVSRLAGVVGGRNTVFTPQSYELSVGKPEEGLFHEPEDSRALVSMSLSGVEYLRLGGGR